MQGSNRFGKARPGKAGQVGSGKARRVAFFWDWVRHGRAGRAGLGLGRHGALRQDEARQVCWGVLGSSMIR